MSKVILEGKTYFADNTKRVLFDQNKRNGLTYNKLEPIQLLEIYLQTN